MKKYLVMSAFVLLYLAVYFIVSNYIGSVFAIIYMIKEIISNPNTLFENPDEFMGTYLESSILFMVIAAVVSFPIYMFIMWLRKENIFKVCEFSKISLKNAAAIALMGITLNFVVEFLIAATSLNELSPSVEKMFRVIFERNSFVTILIGIGIVCPFIEEIIFRGLVFKELKRHLPETAALVIQAFLFGAYHMNLTQGIYAFVLGIILGLVYIWMRSIWAPVLIHIFFNSTSSVLSKLVDQQAVNNHQYIILIGSVFILAVASVFIWKNRKKNLTILSQSI